MSAAPAPLRLLWPRVALAALAASALPLYRLVPDDALALAKWSFLAGFGIVVAATLAAAVSLVRSVFDCIQGERRLAMAELGLALLLAFAAVWPLLFFHEEGC
jgi:hypothetical protein